MKEYIIQQNKTGTLMIYRTERELPDGTCLHFLNSYLKRTWTIIEDVTDLSNFTLTQTRI